MFMQALRWCTGTQSSWAKGIGSFPTWITHFSFRCSKASCLSTLNYRIVFSSAQAYASARHRTSHGEYQKPAFYLGTGFLSCSGLDGRWIKVTHVSNGNVPYSTEMKKGKMERQQERVTIYSNTDCQFKVNFNQSTSHILRPSSKSCSCIFFSMCEVLHCIADCWPLTSFLAALIASYLNLDIPEVN